MNEEIFQFHHTGYAVPDIDRAARALEALGWQAEGVICPDAERKILAEKGFALLLRDAPAPALQGRNVAFYYSKDLGLTEILWL